MQKWRTYYYLKTRPLKKILKNETGITLVELLAAISILSIVILLAGSVHMFGQRQFIDQSKSASQANDLSYAVTIISTDLRKKEIGKIDIKTSEIIEKNNKGSSEVIYSFENNTLKKGEIVLAEDVTGKFIAKTEEPEPGVEESIVEGVQLELQSNSNGGPSNKYETTIYFRR